MNGVANRKRSKPDDAKGKKFPSRDNYRSMYLPKHLYALVEQVAKAEDRSVSYMVKRAVEDMLKARGIDTTPPSDDA